ncbi:MAG: hypothetical protein BWY40_00279 [bacterium ADurb.Bin270]|nr:MAG: hypothetical protein BWY40_00279 [bacterium ADurb.Bin270]
MKAIEARAYVTAKSSSWLLSVSSCVCFPAFALLVICVLSMSAFNSALASTRAFTGLSPRSFISLNDSSYLMSALPRSKLSLSPLMSSVPAAKRYPARLPHLQTSMACIAFHSRVAGSIRPKISLPSTTFRKTSSNSAPLFTWRLHPPSEGSLVLSSLNPSVSTHLFESISQSAFRTSIIVLNESLSSHSCDLNSHLCEPANIVPPFAVR